MRLSAIVISLSLSASSLLFPMSIAPQSLAAVRPVTRHLNARRVSHKLSFDTSLDVQILDKARLYLGYPYVWGGSSPSTGFDCSGFVQYIFGQFHISLPRTTVEQSEMGTLISSRSALQPGDILFFNTTGGISHDGIYIGNDQFINAASKIVEIDSLDNEYWSPRYLFAKRVIQP